jgi:uncharacterized protein (DUF488 family)
VIDVRLNNTSQLAGFAKRDDLEYFLRELCGAAYVHEPRLAPTGEILDDFKKKRISWDEYERRFKKVMEQRKIEEIVDRGLLEEPTVLLCSEPDPEHCHRRLVVEYLKEKWGDLEIIHL